MKIEDGDDELIAAGNAANACFIHPDRRCARVIAPTTSIHVPSIKLSNDQSASAHSCSLLINLCRHVKVEISRRHDATEPRMNLNVCHGLPASKPNFCAPQSLEESGPRFVILKACERFKQESIEFNLFY